MANLLDNASASVKMCVVIITVHYLVTVVKLDNNPHMNYLVAGSIPELGSSKNKRGG